MPKPPTRVALYCRISPRDKDHEGHSIENQLAVNARHAESLGHVPPFCAFIDNLKSGGTVTKRPAMTQLLAEVDAGRITLIVATRLDRLWRSQRDYYVGLEHIGKSGAAISCSAQEVDFTSAQGRMIAGVMGSINQYEREITGDRILEVNQFLTAQGRFIASQPPYGYTYDPATKRLSIEPEQAEVIREIFRLFAEEGWGMARIARHLNERGLRTLAGKLWTRQVIIDKLRNPVYHGEVVYGRRSMSNHTWHREEEDPEGWVRAPGMHEPIVSDALWEAALTRLRSTKRGSTGRSSHRYAGLCVCGYCGSAMHVHPSTSRDGTLYYSFICSRSQSFGRIVGCEEGVCVGVPRVAPVVDRLILENLRGVRETFAGRDAAEPSGLRESVAEEIERRERKVKRLFDLYKMDGIEFDALRREVADERREIERLRETPTRRAVIPASVPADFEAFLDSPEVSEALKHEAVAGMVESIAITRTEIAVRFHDAPKGPLPGWETERREPFKVVRRKKKE